MLLSRTSNHLLSKIRCKRFDIIRLPIIFTNIDTPRYINSGSTNELKRDFINIFNGLQQVPRLATYFGFIGTLPYVATSISYLYLSNIVSSVPTLSTSKDSILLNQTSSIVDYNTAKMLLDWIEPIQIGYGACILSFLGAIHWGFELGKVGGEIGFRRYALGIIPTLIAWPTIFLPINIALVSQFFSFTGMWYADMKATSNGWNPRWYSEYRLWLTGIVGSSIILTLVGKDRIARKIQKDEIIQRMKQREISTTSTRRAENALASPKSQIDKHTDENEMFLVRTDETRGKITGKIDTGLSGGVGSEEGQDHYVRIRKYKKEKEDNE